jgi:glycosyltransferase involved in cell wall biosynthesis
MSTDLVFAFHRLNWSSSNSRGGYYAQDRIVQTLVDGGAPGRVLIADHYASAPVRVVRTLRGDNVPFPRSPALRHYRPLRLRRKDPTDPRLVELTYRRYANKLARAARRNGFARPAVLTTNPHLAAFGDLSWASRVTYYATDDWGAGEERRPVGRAYELAYERIRENGHHVAAVTEQILERIAPKGRRLVLPNAVDPLEWESEGTAPRWFIDLPRPRLVYLGALDYRIDVELLCRAAEAFPEASIVLAGLHLDPARFAPLAKYSNVTVSDREPRDGVIGIVRGADVGLVPHNLTRATRAMSPIKVYEYLAGGLPVVATSLPELSKLGSRVLVAADDRDFLAQLASAIDLGRAPEQERLAFVAANSWRSRHATLLHFATGDEVSPASAVTPDALASRA